MIELVLITLIVAFIGSNIYWALVCLKLTNRIMSKNYAEVVQAEMLKRPPKIVPMDTSDPIAEEHADKANKLFGGI